MTAIPDQPGGIDPHTTDLPKMAADIRRLHAVRSRLISEREATERRTGNLWGALMRAGIGLPDPAVTAAQYVDRLAAHRDQLRIERDDARAEVERLCRKLDNARAALDVEDRAHSQTVVDRDRFEDMADRLAEAISMLTGADIGEHSSGNDPWMRALDAAEGALPRPVTSAPADAEAVAR